MKDLWIFMEMLSVLFHSAGSFPGASGEFCEFDFYTGKRYTGRDSFPLLLDYSE